MSVRKIPPKQPENPNPDYEPPCDYDSISLKKYIYIVVWYSPYTEVEQNEIAFLTEGEAQNYIYNKWKQEPPEAKDYYKRYGGYNYSIDKIKMGGLV